MTTQKQHRRMEEDFNGYVEDVREEYEKCNRGVRASIYAVMQTVATAIAFLMAHPAAMEAFLQNVYFLRRRQKPKRPGVAMMMFLDRADHKNLQERCSRRGRAVEELLNGGSKPNEIAEQLSERGGIMGVLDIAPERGAEDEDEDTADDAAERNRGHRRNVAHRSSVSSFETEDDATVADSDDDDVENVEEDDADTDEDESRQSPISDVSWCTLPIYGYDVCLPVKRPEDLPVVIEAPGQKVWEITKPGVHRLEVRVFPGKAYRRIVVISLDDESFED